MVRGFGDNYNASSRSWDCAYYLPQYIWARDDSGLKVSERVIFILALARYLRRIGRLRQVPRDRALGRFVAD